MGFGVDARELARQLARIDGARSSVVLTRDGIPASDGMMDELEQIFGSLTGAIFHTINKAMQRTGLGELEDLVIRADRGIIQALSAGEYVLVVVGDPDSNVGLIRLGMRRLASTITVDGVES